jgi:hypothetical protein
MPRIHDDHFACVFYLYPSENAAEEGERTGGTGFFVKLQPDPESSARHFAVTNRHVIDGGSVVMRVQRADGSIEVFDTLERDWICHRTDDLAALECRAPIVNAETFAIDVEDFLVPEWIEAHRIGPGDETFSIGRVMNVEGKLRNTPAVRFGNISQVGGEPIVVDSAGWKRPQESILVEARSLPGYSGSPVFVYRPHFAPVEMKNGDPVKAFGHQFGPVLLGVDWAHINEFLEVQDQGGKELPYKVRSNAGIMAVVPAWKLAELIIGGISTSPKPPPTSSVETIS